VADELTKLILGDTAISAIEQAPPPRRRFFGRRKKQRPPLIHCENCGAQLQGHWCAQCGQPAVDYRRSFGRVLVDVLDEFLNWDSKFFATIALLIIKPWRLTNEFLAGHRVRYVHPLRLYLLASILFFFAVNYWAKSIPVQPVSLSSEQRAKIRSDLQSENVSPEARAKVEEALDGLSLTRRAERETESKAEPLPPEERAKAEERLRSEPLPSEARAKMDEALKKLPPDAREKVVLALKQVPEKPIAPVQIDENERANSFGKWLEARAKEKMGEHGTNMQLFIRTLINNLPYMMLCCIPLFAFVLKILYIRRKLFYIDHLIYALHIHTFAYIGIILIVLATLGLDRLIPGPIAGWMIALLWIVFLVQIFLSIRRVYRQGWFFTVFKFFLGGFVYLIVLVFALATTFFVTIALP
jgi:hypothetical protein